MAGIYIHIPFCKQACFYCDFHFSTNMAIKNDMVEAICKEIELQQEYLNGELIRSIYFGGGTPSLLDETHLKSIFNYLNRFHNIAFDAEITFEANPDDITQDKLEILYQNGINRLSVGIQSFDQEVLKWMNRAHNSQEAFRCLELIKKSDFDNFSLDLIYGIPNSTHETWEKDLKSLVGFQPPHISSYCLTIEPNTVFGRWQQKGKLNEASEDYSSEQFLYLSQYLTNSGYEHYEVSNFAKKGFHSKHNSSYWEQKSYLGIGPSAHSYDGKNRQFNVSSNGKYLKALQSNEIPAQLDILTQEDRINEYLMTSLRTSEGCNLKFLANELNYDLVKNAKPQIEHWKNTGLCTLEDDILRLTLKGRLLADKLASDLFLVN
ncbi:radical SAM family heme chaperone HemW [Marivirga harenae]|uniref:radical SAM family heme chaperone HemW n=1 Tax=Marivirga harenae TaxID=2010992 RepID=UPI0026DEF606|nr:radical SAM family heme chaperone HemW [Marivirga harenae]WKV13471.1 radical SAM family heme chaperone HemW [Marivirga harenae]